MRAVLGQNFIMSRIACRNVVNRCGLKKHDLVIEIGPGRGGLTREISKKVTKVIAVEIDKNLVKKLKDEMKHYENLEIIEQDFMQYPLPTEEYVIVANPPFSLTKKIIEKLFFGNEMPPKSAYILMELDAAKMIVGTPFSKMDSQISGALKKNYSLGVRYFMQKNDFVPRIDKQVVLVSIRKRGAKEE